MAKPNIPRVCLMKQDARFVFRVTVSPVRAALPIACTQSTNTFYFYTIACLRVCVVCNQPLDRTRVTSDANLRVLNTTVYVAGV